MLLEGELAYCEPTSIERTLFVPSSDTRVGHLQNTLADLEQEYDAGRTESMRLYARLLSSLVEMIF